MHEFLNRTWRLNNLYKIRNKAGDMVKFVPNQAQVHFDKNKHTRNVICKSRQLGMTTFAGINLLDKALFTHNKIVESAIIAHTLEDASDIFENKVDFAWNNLKKHNVDIRDGIHVDTATAKRLRFGLAGRGSKTHNTISVVNSTRSGTYSDIHVTELSYLDKHFPRKSEEIIAGAIPTLPPDGNLTIESTARGAAGHFYDICMEAYERQKKGYEPAQKQYKLHFYNWTWDEFELSKITKHHIETALKEMPPEFVEIQRAYDFTDLQITCYYYFWISLEKNWELLKQEYPITIEEAFSASVDIVFDSMMLDKQRVKAPRRMGNWKYFADYNSSHVYGLGADVAEGIGKDSSTIAIWDFTENEIVATYTSDRVAPDNFAYEILNGARLYGDCLTAPERNNHGHTTISKLREIYDEDKIYTQKTKTEERNEKETGKFGWYTTSANKPKMFYDLNTAINLESVSLNDERVISEARTYPTSRLNQTKANPKDTQHWDLLTAAVIGYQLRDIAQANQVKPVSSKYNKMNLKRLRNLAG